MYPFQKGFQKIDSGAALRDCAKSYACSIDREFLTIHQSEERGFFYSSPW